MVETLERPTKEYSKKLQKGFQTQPVKYFNDVLKVQLWKKQEEVLNSLVKHKKVACFSGHSLGKDFIGGGLPLWWLSCYKDAIVVMTAPSDRQVEGIMWAELTRHYNRAGGDSVFGGKLLIKKYEITPQRKVLAFTTQDKNGVGKMHGWHTENMLIIISEAQGVEDSIYEQLDGITTAPNSKVVLFGNPVITSGYYARMFRTKEYHKINMNCLDNPNYLQRKTVLPGLASYEWVEEMREKHGENSPVWQAKVLGIVPDISVNSIISQKLARSRVNSPVFKKYYTKRRILAVDPAGMGDDPTQFYVMEEGKIIHSETLGQLTAPELKQKAFDLVIDFECHAVAGDGIGIGEPSLQDLDKTLEKFNIPVFIFKASYSKPEHLDLPNTYYNLRAEAMFQAKEALENSHACFNGDEDLLTEACEHTYFYNKQSGKIQVIDKDTIKDALGTSPNKWDAFYIGIWGLRKLGDITNKSTARWVLSQSKRTKHLISTWDDDDDDDYEDIPGGI